MKAFVGNLPVDVSRDWEIQDPFTRRVAGFTRSSIAVAALMPPLTIVLMSRMWSRAWRFLVAVLAVAVVFMTTQKGAIVAFIPIAAVLCMRPEVQPKLLRLLCMAFITLAIALPLITWGIHLTHGAGVFSTESLYLRIAYTWPDAIDWIQRHQMLVFGVGLGGIGGPQRFYASSSFNPADNIMILLYAYFGVFALIYLGLIIAAVMKPTGEALQRVIPAIAIIAFCFGYGTVLSVIEDQALPLFMGAALGVLCMESRWGLTRNIAPNGLGLHNLALQTPARQAR